VSCLLNLGYAGVYMPDRVACTGERQTSLFQKRLREVAPSHYITPQNFHFTSNTNHVIMCYSMCLCRSAETLLSVLAGRIQP
jgi:hypothetical protein